MSLFEVFRQKQVKISSEVTVNVEYITVGSITDIYDRAIGEILLVKRQLTEHDTSWLQEHKGYYTVFTTEPKTLEAFDSQARLTDTNSVHLMNSIGLNLLHFRDELYAFPDILDSDQAPETPNAVLVYPVRRSDVETQLSINVDAIQTALGIGGPIVENQVENEPGSDATKENIPPKEIDLVRTRLAGLFTEKYSVLRVRFEGAKPENRSVRLTDFYAKNNIAKGKLRGTWSLFDKADLAKIMDAGIVERAKEVVLSKVCVSVPGYDTIIHVEDVEACRTALKTIEAEYKAYLDGKADCTHVGEIKITTAFSPKEAVDATFCELRDYLLSFSLPSDFAFKYEKAVDRFLAKERWKYDSFSDSVRVKPEESAYKESQWESMDFVIALRKAIQKRPDFFDHDFLKLLERYTMLLEEQQNSSH